MRTDPGEITDTNDDGTILDNLPAGANAIDGATSMSYTPRAAVPDDVADYGRC